MQRFPFVSPASQRVHLCFASLLHRPLESADLVVLTLVGRLCSVLFVFYIPPFFDGDHPLVPFLTIGFSSLLLFIPAESDAGATDLNEARQLTESWPWARLVLLCTWICSASSSTAPIRELALRFRLLSLRISNIYSGRINVCTYFRHEAYSKLAMQILYKPLAVLIVWYHPASSSILTRLGVKLQKPGEADCAIPPS